MIFGLCYFLMFTFPITFRIYHYLSFTFLAFPFRYIILSVFVMRSFLHAFSEEQMSILSTRVETGQKKVTYKFNLVYQWVLLELLTHTWVIGWLKENCITVTSTPSMSDNSGKLKSWNALCKLETVWLVVKSPLSSATVYCFWQLWRNESHESYFLNPVNIMGFWVLRNSPSSRSKFQFRGDNYIHSTYSSDSCILFISSSMMFLGYWKGTCRCLIFLCHLWPMIGTLWEQQ